MSYLVWRCSRSTGASARSAWFTRRPSGKTSSTEGSMTTTLAPSRYLAAVAPRTARLKSYSGRIVSRSRSRLRRLGFFFISLPFGPRCPACRNQFQMYIPPLRSRPRQPNSTGQRAFETSYFVARKTAPDIVIFLVSRAPSFSRLLTCHRLRVRPAHSETVRFALSQSVALRQPRGLENRRFDSG